MLTDKCKVSMKEKLELDEFLRTFFPCWSAADNKMRLRGEGEPRRRFFAGGIVPLNFFRITFHKCNFHHIPCMRNTAPSAGRRARDPARRFCPRRGEIALAGTARVPGRYQAMPSHNGTQGCGLKRSAPRKATKNACLRNFESHTQAPSCKTVIRFPPVQ